MTMLLRCDVAGRGGSATPDFYEEDHSNPSIVIICTQSYEMMKIWLKAVSIYRVRLIL